MPEKKQLFISDPCHEQWGNMQPNNDGRFCGACSKTVVDFTIMSDPEMIAWFARADKNVCGRFTDDQLNRDLTPAKSPKRNRWAVLNYLLAGLLISSEVRAQEQAPKPTVSLVEKQIEGEPVTSGLVAMKMPTDNSYITLKVVDNSTGRPVSWAILQIDAKKFQTDDNGTCSIKREDILKGHQITILSIGYEKKVVQINKQFLQNFSPVITLTQQMASMGDVVMVAGKVSQRQAAKAAAPVRISIVDSATGKPIPGASVQVDNDPKYIIADSGGVVSLPYKKLIHAGTLQASSIGYTHAMVTVNNDWLSLPDKTIPLASRATELQAIAVKGYYTTTGRFIMGATSVGIKARTLQQVAKDTLVFFGLAKKPLTVYPNPVARGASVTLSLQMDQPGNYMIQLFSGAGALVESMHLEGVDGPRTELLEIPGTLAAGIYFIRLLNTQTGKLYKEKVMVL